MPRKVRSGGSAVEEGAGPAPRAASVMVANGAVDSAAVDSAADGAADRAVSGASVAVPDVAMADVGEEVTRPTTPDGSTGVPASDVTSEGADSVLASYAAMNLRVEELVDSIQTVSGLHRKALEGAGEGVSILSAVQKDSRDYVAWKDAGREALCLLAGIAADSCEVFANSAAVCEKLKPLKERAEEVRLEEENLAYRREMLKRDIQVQQARQANPLGDMDLTSAEGLFEAAGASELLPSFSGQTVPTSGVVPSLNLEKAGAGAGDASAGPSTPATRAQSRPVRRTSGRVRRGKDAEKSAEKDQNNSVSRTETQAAVNSVNVDQAATPKQPALKFPLKCLDSAVLAHPAGHPDRQHYLMLDRLDYELKERQRLEGATKDTEGTMNMLRSRNEEDRQFMANLPTYVKELRKSLDPLRHVVSAAESDATKEGTASGAGSGVPRLMPVEESAILRELPTPLFILAREAMAARDAFGSSITFEILSEDPSSPNSAPSAAERELPLYPTPSKKDVEAIRRCLELFRTEVVPGTSGTREVATASRSGTGSCEALQGEAAVSPKETDSDLHTKLLENLHRAHRRFVRIHIHRNLEAKDAGGPPKKSPRASSSRKKARTNSSRKEAPTSLLSLSFRLHPALGIMTVSCESPQGVSAVTTDDLCALFPFDFGDSSPCPSNAHLLEGSFKFSRELCAGSGRPYLWANLLGGLHFPGTLRREMKHAEQAIPAEFLRWPEVAMGTPAHLRFVDVIQQLHLRVSHKRSLRSQLESLCAKKFGIPWKDIGQSHAPQSKLAVFAPCPEGDGEGFEWDAAINEKVMEVWVFTADHPSGVGVAGIVGLEPDYPSSVGHIRLSSNGKVAIPGADIREMEDKVNPSPLDSPMGEGPAGDLFDKRGFKANTSNPAPSGGDGLSSLANGFATSCGASSRVTSVGLEESGDWLSAVPEEFAISAQIMRVLLCLDMVSSGMRARANAEVPGAEFQNGSASVAADDEGNAIVSGDQGRSTRRKREVVGRGRSKMQSL